MNRNELSRLLGVGDDCDDGIEGIVDAVDDRGGDVCAVVDDDGVVVVVLAAVIGGGVHESSSESITITLPATVDAVVLGVVDFVVVNDDDVVVVILGVVVDGDGVVEE